jgi:hypothetical protein
MLKLVERRHIMQITLTLHELSAGTGPVLQYRVGSLPTGHKAFIAKFCGGSEDSWRIHHTKGGVSSPWNGDYKTADEALTELQKQY